MSSDLTNVDPGWAWSPFQPDEKTPWTTAHAAHLYRRAGFAANSRQLQAAVAQQPGDLVRQLFVPDGTAAFEREMDSLGSTILASRDARSLSAWWLYRMLKTPDQLLEKTTLFWHGHFATSAAKVTDAPAMLRQNALLRKYAHGNFVELVEEISRDPAMLTYLDSTTNRKTHPNENYARELMELFCLGVGNYSEQDIQEIARCFTGWEVQNGQFRFNKYQHDPGVKSVLGQSGQFGGEDAVRIVLDQPAAPRFIAAKLIRFFVFDEPQAPAAIVEPLANQLRDNGFQVGAVIERILGSQLFFSEHAIGRKLRSPIELGVGLLRALEGSTNLYRLAEEVAELGQSPFYPPNVKGWDGGRTWINSSTLLGRANLVRQLVQSPESRFAGGKLAELAEQHQASSPERLVDWLLELLLAGPVSADVRDPLVKLANENRNGDNVRVTNVIQAIGALPEFQLG